MKLISYILVSLLLLSCDALSAVDKRVENELVLHILISVNSEDASERSAAVDQVLKIKDPQVLAKVAILSSDIAWPQNAGDEKYDIPFDRMFWICVNGIANKCSVGKESEVALLSIRKQVRLDAGTMLQFEEIISKNFPSLCMYLPNSQ